jgi:hypothetical protein
VFWYGTLIPAAEFPDGYVMRAATVRADRASNLMYTHQDGGRVMPKEVCMPPDSVLDLTALAEDSSAIAANTLPGAG